MRCWTDYKSRTSRWGHFNADVAHELNNPLSILIGSCEVALRRPRSAAELHDTLSSNLEELRRIATIVADMLFLSSAERGTPARRSFPMSIADLAAEVADFHEFVLEEAELRVEVRGDARAAVDAGLVRRAMSNLLSNASRYATRGSLIEVRIARVDPRHVSIGVHNQGPVIPGRASAASVRPVLPRRSVTNKCRPKPRFGTVHRRSHCTHARWDRHRGVNGSRYVHPLHAGGPWCV